MSHRFGLATCLIEDLFLQGLLRNREPLNVDLSMTRLHHLAREKVIVGYLDQITGTAAHQVFLWCGRVAVTGRPNDLAVNFKENRAALAKRKRERVGEDEEMEDGELDTNDSRAAKRRTPDSPGISEGAPSQDAAAISSTSVPVHTAPDDAAPAPATHSVTKSSSGSVKPKPKKPAGRRVPTAPKASASTTNPTQHASDPVVSTPSGRARSKKPADLSINTAIALSPNSQAIIDKAQNDIEIADGSAAAPSA
ncbi:hypothetical protein GGX14DRAFT_565526 [Mycena pura]|uniref:Uncharacterized protein n=1 Tax=Mycena pura TaxID=153505 RepID=A0AAD6YBN9_9AGAR|nr:hypothetical protein GGX14DRAFT_565526 [Mycena pura]